ncbi:hypothetical protein FA95DRAFT_15408 [Auriscalpium vulgare]|uniref:Uncharacterized protein n=1 Tax=Auriscalpium vulgare TaxID=40419 RepID=A0ACB8SDE3_9AGAM|nr:hypothetical protein FA95DRAFT_15408 [Auriscalpium vulgare]
MSDAGYKQAKASLPTQKKDLSAKTSDRKMRKSVKTAKARETPGLRELDALHVTTGVAANLKIPEGRRIKLEDDTVFKPPPPSSAKGKPIPRFDMDFSVLQDADAPFSAPDLPTSIDSDEDLPDPHQLLRTLTSAPHRTPSAPSTSYSDPEMDALVRDATMDDVISLSDESDVAAPAGELNWGQPRTPSPSWKRKRAAVVDDSSSPLKRVKLDRAAHVTKADAAEATRDQAKPAPPEAAKEPLFLQSDGDPNHSLATGWDGNTTAYDDEDDFILDESLFDIIDADEAPPAKSAPTFTEAPLKPSLPLPQAPCYDAHEMLPSQAEPSFYVSAKRMMSENTQPQSDSRAPTASPLRESHPPATAAAVEEELDPYEEFEQWLATTNSVVIID